MRIQTLVVRKIHNFLRYKKKYKRLLIQTLVDNQQQCWSDTSSLEAKNNSYTFFWFSNKTQPCTKVDQEVQLPGFDS